MKYLLLAGFAAFVAPLAGAQSLASLPKCAQSAASTGISSSGCELTDFTCICKASAFLQSLEGLIDSECDPADQQATLSFAQEVCNSAGVPLSLPSSGSSSSSAAPAPTSSASSASTASSVAPSTSSSAYSAATTGAPSATNGTNGTMTPMPFAGGASGLQANAAAMALVMAGVVGYFL
ncbi:hypothetical protein MMC28_002326 [Mycoblastus sanguinarius]|nr:hypothetical protein [Mycoblastus sanguinarius]